MPQGVRVQLSPRPPRLLLYEICGGGSVVERHLAKVDVAGSSPVPRSIVFRIGYSLLYPFFYEGNEYAGYAGTDQSM